MGLSVLLFALLMGSLFAVRPALADDGPSQDEVNAVARKLFCPVCENTPLDVCPTEACQNWRDEIRVGLAEGQSEQDILQEFATKYGDSVLAEPPANQWVAWSLPAVIVLVAFAALAYWLRSWTRPVAPVAAPSVAPVELDPADDPYLAQLEKELKEWER